MTQRMTGAEEHGEHQGEDRSPGPDPRRPAVIAFALMLALVVGVYFLLTALQRNAAIEDCLMAGRRNCAPIEPSSP